MAYPTLKGAAPGTAPGSIVMPSHIVGDLLIAVVIGYSAVPVAPTGWTSVQAFAGGTFANIQVAYKFAASSSETFGTWTSGSLATVFSLLGSSVATTITSGSSPSWLGPIAAQRQQNGPYNRNIPAILEAQEAIRFFVAGAQNIGGNPFFATLRMNGGSSLTSSLSNLALGYTTDFTGCTGYWEKTIYSSYMGVTTFYVLSPTSIVASPKSVGGNKEQLVNVPAIRTSNF